MVLIGETNWFETSAELTKKAPPYSSKRARAELRKTFAALGRRLDILPRQAARHGPRDSGLTVRRTARDAWVRWQFDSWFVMSAHQRSRTLIRARNRAARACEATQLTAGQQPLAPSPSRPAPSRSVPPPRAISGGRDAPGGVQRQTAAVRQGSYMPVGG